MPDLRLCKVCGEEPGRGDGMCDYCAYIWAQGECFDTEELHERMRSNGVPVIREVNRGYSIRTIGDEV